MKQKILFAAITAATAVIGAATAAYANDAFDACVDKLCVSSDQMNCWVKSGGELCDDNGACLDVPDHAGALALERGDGQWKVQTQYGTGWVRDRYLMVDGSFCPDL